METQHFQARSVSEILDASVRLVKQHYKSLVALSAIGYMPALLVGLLVPQPTPGAEVTPADVTAQLMGSLMMIPVLLWYAVVATAMVVFAANAFVGRETSPGASLRQVFGRAGTLLGATILKWVIIFLLMMILTVLFAGIVGVLVATVSNPVLTVVAGTAFVVVGVLLMFALMARYFFVAAAVALEDSGAVAALRRSSELTRGAIWRVIACMLLFYVIVAAVWITLFVLGMTVASSFVVGNTLGSAAMILIFPLFPAITALLYYDLRIRKEGYDLELMAQSLGGSSPSSSMAEGVRGA